MTGPGRARAGPGLAGPGRAGRGRLAPPSPRRGARVAPGLHRDATRMDVVANDSRSGRALLRKVIVWHINVRAKLLATRSREK